MTGKVILGLDLGANLGFCVGASGSKPAMGSVSLRSMSADDGAKYCVLSDWLAPMLTLYKPFRVIYEAPMMTMPKKDDKGSGGNSRTMLALIGYSVVVDMLCHRWGIRVVKTASQSARKHFVGHGRPENPKDTVFAECRRRGWEPQDFNVSDSCAVWDHGCFMYDPDNYRISYRST